MSNRSEKQHVLIIVLLPHSNIGSGPTEDSKLSLGVNGDLSSPPEAPVTPLRHKTCEIMDGYVLLAPAGTC